MVRLSDKRIAVIAGNWTEFCQWCYANELPVSDVVWVDTVDKLRDWLPEVIIRTGQWQSNAVATSHELAMMEARLREKRRRGE